MTDTNDDIELVRGSGNVFADFGAADASLRQLRAILAAEVIKTLDKDKLSVREAAARTGIAAADFSRIRQARLERFTIDRLMRILDRLNRDVRVKVSVGSRTPAAGRKPAAPLAA
jgi:predicted XRE-type DNA-binding protein